MGRAEMRRKERERRIERNKIINNLTKNGPTNEMIEKAVHIASANNVELLMTCFALSLYDEFGFKEKRISRCLNKVSEYMNKVVNDEVDLKDLQKRLEKNTGIEIKCE